MSGYTISEDNHYQLGYDDGYFDHYPSSLLRDKPEYQMGYTDGQGDWATGRNLSHQIMRIIGHEDYPML